MSNRGLRWVGAVAGVPVAVLAAWLVLRWGGSYPTRVADDVALLLLAMFAAGSCVVAALRAAGRNRWSWMALGAGLAGWSAGEVAWCYFEIVRRLPQTPFPSVADVGYLGFPVGAAAWLVLFPKGRVDHPRLRLLLDGMIAAGSLFIVSWISVIGTVYQTGASRGLALGVSLAYPIADLVLVTMTVMVLSRAHPPQRLPLALATAGIVVMSLADSWFAYLTATDPYRTGDLIDLGWLAAFWLFGIAGLASTRPISQGHEYATHDAPEPARVRLWLPYAPLLLVCLVGAHQAFPTLRTGPVPTAGLIVVVVVLARQFVTVADNQRLLDTVAHQALHDPLTGLANRALFADRLQRAVELQRRDLRPLAVLMIDLNDFKLVNDRHGHHAGDELLIRVAERLTGCLRTTDTVARLGGDEFAVLIEDEPDAAALAAGRVRDAFGPVFVVDGRPLRVTASIGLACTAGHAVEVTAESLLKDADLAMYAVKREHATTEPPSRRTGHPSGTAQSPPARRPAAPRRPV